MEDNIELMIKLPKGIYVASQMLDIKPDDVVQIPLEVIANGTPLPKGHGKIIDESRITEVYIETTEKEYIHGVLIPPRIKIVGTNATTIIEADNVKSEE
ncbi:MAG: hypothetical protein K5895_05250 [Lachnospiraceae bacterium]|nr:hypothetical protein [Lachnospiraceae bacterium]